jgi:hypothetical protein
MAGPRTVRLVETVLRCYPARWRRRHGDEAAELAVLLIRDGAAPGWIAWSFLVGAARERLTPRPGRRLSLAVCALLVAAASLGVSLGLVSGSAPARAASTVPPSSHSRCHPRPAAPDRNGPRRRLHLAGGHDQSC